MVAEGSMLASKKDHIVYLSNSLRASWWGLFGVAQADCQGLTAVPACRQFPQQNISLKIGGVSADHLLLSLSVCSWLHWSTRDLSGQTVLHRPQLLAWNKESIKVSFVHLNWSHKVWRYILASWILKNLCYKHVLSFILQRNVVLSWVILRINSYLG